MNIVCVICGDVFTGKTENECIYATQCGHVFHYTCLLEWLERSKTCPQCRNKTSEKNIFRIYFNNTNPGEADTSFLKYKVDGMEFQIKMHEMEIKKLIEEKAKAESQNVGLRKEVKTMKLSVVSAEQTVYVLKDEVKSLKSYCKQLSENKLENEELKRKLTRYNGIQMILEGSVDEADCVVQNTDLEAEHLRLCIKQFKQTIKNLEKEHKETETELLYYKRKLNIQAKACSDIEQKYEKLKKLQTFKENENEDCNSTINISSDIEGSERSNFPRLTSTPKQISINVLQTKRPSSSPMASSLLKNVRLSKPIPIYKSKSSSLIGVTQSKSQTRGALPTSSGDDVYHPNKYVLDKGTKKVKKLSSSAFTGVQKSISDYKSINVKHVQM